QSRNPAPLLGEHNVYNMLSAVAAILGGDISLDAVVRGLQSLDRVPGRFECVALGQDFIVAVDYAHTDDALANALRAARTIARGKVVLVFGCGGDRDRGKRKEMGREALDGSDLAVITSDNPRSEDPDRIIRDICEGIPSGAKLGEDYVVKPDRKEAIEWAVNRAQPGDTVLIAGKGHEDYQILKTQTIHFDDREVAGEALKKRLCLD
ncbi:MAG: Mur ligase family protein, partial [Nitrospinales bacterium]